MLAFSIRWWLCFPWGRLENMSEFVKVPRFWNSYSGIGLEGPSWVIESSCLSQASISSHLLCNLFFFCKITSSTCNFDSFLPAPSQQSLPIFHCSDVEIFSHCHRNVPVVGLPSPERSFAVEWHQASSANAVPEWTAGLCLCRTTVAARHLRPARSSLCPPSYVMPRYIFFYPNLKQFA